MSRRIYVENSQSDDDNDFSHEDNNDITTDEDSGTSETIADKIEAEIEELNSEIKIYKEKVAAKRAQVQNLQKKLGARSTRRRPLEGNADSVLLGPGGTRVPASVVDRVLSTNLRMTYTKATRALLVAVFGNRVLAESSLTGIRSNAHPNTAAKRRLDPDKVADIVKYVEVNFTAGKNLIHHCITTKCADEAKAARNNAQRRSHDR